MTSIRMRTRFAGLALLALGSAPAFAGPDGPVVERGRVDVSNPGSPHVRIHQHSDRAVINWRHFDIGTGERTDIYQPSMWSVLLNRVTGGLGPTMIDGMLNANGRVFIINRDGVLIGRNGSINTSGFLATTNDIANDDFMAGRYNFRIPGRPDASIVNLGTITANNGGFAALVAPGVRNSGTITATLGKVGLAASNDFSLDLYGDQLINLGVGDQIAGQVRDVQTGLPLRSLVSNSGAISANGGRVELTAAAARQVVDSVINNTGVIEANTVGTQRGMIVLGAATDAQLPPGAPPQRVRISGRISATGNERTPDAEAFSPNSAPGPRGGTVVVSGGAIEVQGARIDVTGLGGGGTVLIGGDWAGGHPTGRIDHPGARLESFRVPTASTVSVDATSVIDASSTGGGSGGKVVLWSDRLTTFHGMILARGGPLGGDGGFAEVSGKKLVYEGTADTRAPLGRAGTLLLDPENYYVNTAGTPGDPGASAISVAALLNALTLGNVVLETLSTGVNAGNIFIQNGFTWTGNNSLTLRGHNNVQINDGVTIANVGAGNLVVRADSDADGFGTLIMQQFTLGARIDFTASTGRVEILYNPGSYSAPTDYTPAGQGTGRGVLVGMPSQLTAYMLVNSVADLVDIDINPGGTYALGKDIAGTTFTPIFNTFTGLLDGRGHTISGLNITSTITGDNRIGLFNTIGATGTVRNLNLSNITVTSNFNAGTTSQWLGLLAGLNHGRVEFVNASGTVSHGTINSGIYAGGLIGQNQSTGQIVNSNANVNVTVGDATTGSQLNYAGGLVAINHGLIANSSAQGSIAGGSFSFLGGLVGSNETGGTIDASSASASVTINAANGIGNAGGGLVGFNRGHIEDSQASGAVSGASSNVFMAAQLGGFVGLNETGGTVTRSHASGSVTGGAGSSAGGFVGSNDGTITFAHATGSVFSADNFAGGFAGWNTGTITDSYATGAVSGSGFGVGGFVGANDGDVMRAYATGAVTGGDGAIAGGFAGLNIGMISVAYATGNVSGGVGSALGGFAGENFGQIVQATASGNVSGGPGSVLGGFVALNAGDINTAIAYGNVLGGEGSMAGGFAGINLLGNIEFAHAAGKVEAGGYGMAGGFVAINSGSISRAFSVGPVMVGANGLAGGFAALNMDLTGQGSATISQAYSIGSVSGGEGSYVGGFAALNAGSLDQTYAAGRVTTGAGGQTGGLVALNSNAIPAHLVGLLPGPAPTPQQGTITNSYWDMQTTGLRTSDGGTGLYTAQLVGGLPPGFDPQVWQIGTGTYPYLHGQPDPIPFPGLPVLGADGPTQQPSLLEIITTQDQPQLASLPADEVVNTQNATRPPQRANSNQPPGNQRVEPSGIPPPNENRFIQDQVVIQVDAGLSDQRLQEIARQFGLSLVSSQDLGLLGRRIVQFRIVGNRNVRQIIAALERARVALGVQPNYTYTLAQQSRDEDAPPQYVVEKLRLPETHQLAKGANVLVAVIDSKIDPAHPDLDGVVAGSFTAVEGEEAAHAHGTGMAGAIASRRKLLGTAPAARILAAHAFSTRAQSGSTTMHILKSLDWAVNQGARVINMSFAGPRDPSLEKALKAARERGIVLIAAAGNAGPKSPPLFPGADPNVIAVTATDVDDKIFVNANRGGHIAVAAPGVDIIVPAPEGSYQTTTGTSVATAHVSGIAALLLERNPSLTPDQVRKILTSSAKPLGAGPRDKTYGAGLVDAYKAITSLGVPAGAQPAQR